MKWYVSRGGVIAGPMDRGELERFAAQGLLVPGMLLKLDGSGEWVPVEQGEFARLVRPASPRSSLRTALLWAALALAVLFLAMVSIALYEMYDAMRG